MRILTYLTLIAMIIAIIKYLPQTFKEIKEMILDDNSNIYN